MNTVTLTKSNYFLLFLLLLASACTSTPERQAGPVFYPALPNPPRIQHLHSISSLKDIGGGSAFAEFVMGTDLNEALVKKPYGVAVYKGKIYVTDTRGPGYVVIDLVKKEYRLITGGGAGRIKKPINIMIDQDGLRYITDTGRNQVLVFDTNDRFLRAYGVEGQFKPADIEIIGKRMYVSDLKHHMVHVLDKKTGKTLFKMATPASKNKKAIVQFPTNMAVYQDKLFISDTGNFKIVKFTLDGKFVQSLGTVGSSVGKFARPKGIAVDREGRLYVVDSAFENIQVFNKQGKLLMFFGGPGGAPEHINLPTGVVIDYDNVQYFQKYAAPGFKLEYIIIVASQFGANKINVFGYGKMDGMDYTTAKK